MSPAICFSLDQSKILSSGNELKRNKTLLGMRYFSLSHDALKSAFPLGSIQLCIIE